jgi:hypothetical protein
MNTERIVRIVAGLFVMISVILTLIYSKWWLVFTLFVGANLFQSGITKWCLMEDILKKLGVKSCCAEKELEEKNANL